MLVKLIFTFFLESLKVNEYCKNPVLTGNMQIVDRSVDQNWNEYQLDYHHWIADSIQHRIAS